jgi:hypothetical protein
MPGLGQRYQPHVPGESAVYEVVVVAQQAAIDKREAW